MSPASLNGEGEGERGAAKEGGRGDEGRLGRWSQYREGGGVVEWLKTIHRLPPPLKC